MASNGLSMVHAEMKEGAEIVSARFHGMTSLAERRELLKRSVQASGLSNSRVRMILDHGQYRLLQVAAPEVPVAEMADALRWKVQDLLEYPVDEAEIEFFQMPQSAQAHRDRMVTVAVCRSSAIRELSDVVKESGLVLDVIDIPELCLSNLVVRFPEAERGVALLYLKGNHGVLLIQKGESVYLFRDLEVDGEMLASSLGQMAADRASAEADHLALDIQRSLDYYESYYGMPSVGSLVVAPMAQHTQALVDALNQSLGVISRAMDVSAIVRCRERLDDVTQQACLPAIGAILRT